MRFRLENILQAEILIRFIVRPQGIAATPNRLKIALTAHSTKLIKPFRTFDWHRDFFLAYPQTLLNKPTSYDELLRFYHSDKLRQRALLQTYGFKVPYTSGLPSWENRAEGLRYVVRPLRHSQGRDYRLTDDPTDFNPSCQYLSQVFPKRWEYRVLTCYGSRVATLLKQTTDTSPEMPWNHTQGSRFCTINSLENDRLRHTDFYNVLSTCPVAQLASLAGIDVMVTKIPGGSFEYSVCELNFAPSLTLNLSTVQSVVSGRLLSHGSVQSSLRH